MSKGKKIRQKGKIKLSQYFKKIEDGVRVCVVKEASVLAGFPKKIIGKSGLTKGVRGRYNLVEIKDGNKTKTFIIHPIHLKLLK